MRGIYQVFVFTFPGNLQIRWLNSFLSFASEDSFIALRIKGFQIFFTKSGKEDDVSMHN